MSNSSFETIVNKLDKFIRKYYQNQLIKGILLSLAIVIMFFLGVSFLEYFGEFNPNIRTVLFYSFLAVTSGVLVKYVLIPINGMLKIGKIITEEQAAEIIGKHFSSVNDKLLNILQLQKQSKTETGELLLASINQKVMELDPISFAGAIDFSQNKKHLKYVLPPLFFLMGILLFFPSALTKSTDRLVHHSTDFKAIAPFQFSVINKDLTAIQHEDFELQVAITGNQIPEKIFVEFENHEIKLKKNADNNYFYTFKGLQNTIDFHLSANGYLSKKHTITVIPKPILLSFKVQLKYPKYIEKKNDSYSNKGDLLIPEGTEIKWNFNTKNTNKIKLFFTDSTYFLSSQNKNQYNFNKAFYNSSMYSVTSFNEQIKNKDSVLYNIQVVKDKYPSIQLVEKVDSLSSKQIYFSGEVKDDYGLTALIFNYKVFSKNKKTENNNDFIIEKLNIGSGILNQFFYFWDRSKLQIEPGDKVAYYFEVWDNDGINGNKSSKSKIVTFEAPSLEKIEEQKNKNNDVLKDDIEASIDQAKELQEELKKLQQKLVNKKQLSWEDKKNIEKLIKKQKDLQKNIENIKNDNKQNNIKQQEYKLNNEKIVEKQKKIEELFEQVMSEEMKEKFKELENLLQQEDKKKMQEMIEEMQLSNKDIEKELDRTLEVFKQLELEQKLQENIEKLDELSKKQEELAEKTKDKNSDVEENKKEQEKLNEAFKKLEEDLKDMEKKNQELEQPNDMESTKEDQKNIELSQQNSSENLSKNKKSKASQSQQDAADKMKKLSEKLQQQQSDMEQEGSEEDLDAMRQLLENLVSLSFDQEDLMKSLKTLNKKDPKYVKIGQEQKKLKDDAKMIEDSLFALSKRVPEISAIINREIAAINLNMKNTLDFIGERQTPQAVAKQQYTMTAVNNLALLMDEIVQQMQQQMSQKKFGKSSCNKPKGGKPKPGGMKKMQQQLNKQLEGMKKGKKPGKKQGKGMSMQLAKMAAQQEAIRNEVQKMVKKMGKKGNMGEKGKLQKLAKLMEETETDIVNKNITAQTLKRQQEILTRLLEHEKAQRERDQDEKREAKEAQTKNFGNPSEFLEYKKMKQKEIELLRTVPPSLNQFYKKKVNEYFLDIQ